MAFKYSAAALAASSLLVNAAPVQQHQPEQVARPWYDPTSYGVGYGYGWNNDNDNSYPKQPQAEDYWGPNGFNGEAWNNDHRTSPYPRGYSSNYKSRSQADLNAPELGPLRPGSIFRGGDDDGDDDTTIILLNPFDIISNFLSLPDLWSFFGDFFGIPGSDDPSPDAPRPFRPRPQGYPSGQNYPQGYPQPATPKGYPKGQTYPQGLPLPSVPKGYPKGQNFPQGYPLPSLPKGYPRPQPYPKGVQPIAPLVSNLPNGAGQASLGLLGGGFSLEPVAGLPNANPLPYGSPAGPFPKGWPTLVGGAPPAMTPGNGAPGFTGALPGGAAAAPVPAAPLASHLPGGVGSADLGLIGGSFSLNGAAAGAAPAITPAPVAPAAGGIVAPLASSAGAQSLGLLGAGFSLNGAAGAAVPTPAAAVIPAALPVAGANGATLSGGSGTFSLDSAAASPATAPSAAALPIAAASHSPAAAAAPVAGASLSGGSGTFSLDGAAASPVAAAAAVSSPSPAASPAAMTQTDAGIAGNAAAGLGGLTSSATIS